MSDTRGCGSGTTARTAGGPTCSTPAASGPLRQPDGMWSGTPARTGRCSCRRDPVAPPHPHRSHAARLWPAACSRRQPDELEPLGRADRRPGRRRAADPSVRSRVHHRHHRHLGRRRDRPPARVEVTAKGRINRRSESGFLDLELGAPDPDLVSFDAAGGGSPADRGDLDLVQAIERYSRDQAARHVGRPGVDHGAGARGGDLRRRLRSAAAGPPQEFVTDTLRASRPAAALGQSRGVDPHPLVNGMIFADGRHGVHRGWAGDRGRAGPPGRGPRGAGDPMA